MKKMIIFGAAAVLVLGMGTAVFASNTEIAGRGAGFATYCPESGYCTDHMDGDNDGICDDCQYDLGSLDTGRHHNNSCYYNNDGVAVCAGGHDADAECVGGHDSHKVCNGGHNADKVCLGGHDILADSSTSTGSHHFSEHHSGKRTRGAHHK